MQQIISFNESVVSPEVWAIYQKMTHSLPDSEKILGTDILVVGKTAIQWVSHAMEELKTYCENHAFLDPSSEINFFKIIKPQFHAQLVFWMYIYGVEVNRPVGGSKSQSKYVKKHLSHLQEFFLRHIDFYQYYRTGQTDRDEIYFLRKTKIYTHLTDPFLINSNSQFSTSHDYLVAMILGNELIEKYLTKSMFRESTPDIPKSPNMTSSQLHWTASKTGLVELIYALQTAGVFNDGKAMVHEIATLFQEQFDVKLVNYYHTFNELRSRKKNRTAFMQTLRDNLAQKMDGLED